MILSRIFGDTPIGFYVDVGAHHPFRFSNTYYFYKKGWRGINIDAMPNSMKLFNRFRSRDVNLEIPISDSEQVLTYFSFNEPAINGFSKELSRERHGKNGYFIQQEIKLKTSKLSSVLDEHLDSGVKIDFLSIDVEGLDINILKSNNWVKYRPKCILIEVLGSSLSDITNGEIAILLKQYGYGIFAKSVHTVFFIEE
jgi:FkbM family methyltransferase